MFLTAALVAPYGADGAARFGLYDVIEAVKTMEPLIPSAMNLRAATVADAQAPNTLGLNSCSICAMEKSSAG
jgi:hypothetical protein